MRWRYQNLFCLVFLIFILFIQGIVTQHVDKICATLTHSTQCEQLQRGDSEMECQIVQDSIECAQRIRNQTADFGIFSAESVLHLASLNWPEMTVIREHRHRERTAETVDYQSVVVVKKTFKGDLSNLKGLKFCHPGLFYDKSHRWTERFLKHFERTVINPDCRKASEQSPSEIEASSLSNFFTAACRPGLWSSDVEEDQILKKKYSNLCSLCDGSNCDYKQIQRENNHYNALQCLKREGDIAYVSAQEASKFMEKENANLSGEYSYLCPNGSTYSLPCPWLKQPWGAIIAHTDKHLNLNPKIQRILTTVNRNNWEKAINEILTHDNYIPFQTTIQYPRDYIKFYREIPTQSNICEGVINWCTISPDEAEKCEIIKHAGITSGVLPEIQCKQTANSDVECLNEIKEKKSDFTGIDSNFGFLARDLYNLTNALYAETDNSKYSSVVVVVHDGSQYEKFENLKNSKVCFPEYGGIASMAFINIGKSRGFLSAKECNEGKLLSGFFSEACAPGAVDYLHAKEKYKNLCSLCSGCDAIPSNQYYGNKGALLCLKESGNVAVLELQTLVEHAQNLTVDPNEFRIICRNGTLASYPGFKVDLDCALTTIVDGEIVVRPKEPSKTQGIINALLSLDKYFLLQPDFKMYNIFSSKRNLLFKDSTLGLTKAGDSQTAVKDYIQLFKNVDNCVQDRNSAVSMSINLLYLVVFGTVCTYFHSFLL